MKKYGATFTPLLLLLATACSSGEVRGFRFAETFNRDPAGNTLAVITLVFMLASVVGVALAYVNNRRTFFQRLPDWALPALFAAGLAVSIYLTYVEVTKTEAFCGPVGNCNAVQTSEYAYVMGVPVGLLGIAGYVLLLAVWAVRKYGHRDLRKPSSLALWGMAWFGVLFSIYLTFLEPFVIGATCIWCVTSAVVMTLVLWGTTDLGIEALS